MYLNKIKIVPVKQTVNGLHSIDIFLCIAPSTQFYNECIHPLIQYGIDPRKCIHIMTHGEDANAQLRALEIAYAKPTWNTCAILAHTFRFRNIHNTHEILKAVQQSHSFDVCMLSHDSTSFNVFRSSITSIYKVAEASGTQAYIVHKTALPSLLNCCKESIDKSKVFGKMYKYKYDELWKQLQATQTWIAFDPPA